MAEAELETTKVVLKNVDETKKVLRIVDADRYEVSEKGHRWLKSQVKRSGPIPAVRIKVNGLKISPGYNDFLEIAGVSRAAYCFGVFIKLLEVAADQPVERRWLILDHRGTPGNSRELAKRWGFSQRHVDQAIEVLTDERVRWLEWIDFEDLLLGDAPGSSREFPGVPGSRAGANQIKTTTSSSLTRRDETRRDDEKVDCDWTEIRALTHRAAKRINLPCDKPENQSLLLKASYLVLYGPLSENWLWDSIDGLNSARKRTDPTKKPKKPWAFLQRCLANKARDAGQNLNQLMAAVEVPEQYLAKPEVSDDRKQA